MKKFIAFTLVLTSFSVLAFDFKGLVEKVQKDKKMQEQIKDGAKKAYDYFQGEEKKEETSTSSNTPKESETPPKTAL